MAERTYYVYKHTFPNGKIYIGITYDIKQRWGYNGSGYSTQQRMKGAILKYGWNNIEHEILHTNLSYEDACKKEIYYIKFYKSNDRKYGYNVSSGGESSKGIIMSKKARRKIAIANHNRIITQETHLKLKAIHKGKNNSFGYKILLQFAKDGTFIREYEYVNQVKEFGYHSPNVISCAKGRIPTAYGYVWKYKDNILHKHLEEN